MVFRSFAKIVRWGLFFTTLAFTLCWVVAGHRLAQETGAPVNPEEAAKKITKKLETENPQAAAELTRIRENSDIRAVAAVLYEADARGGVSAVQEVVDRKTSFGRTPPEIRLVSLAIDPNLLTNAASRDEFLWAHTSSLQLLDHDDTGEATNAYLDRLEQASHTPESWRVARSNPMAMLVLECIPSSQFRDFYEQEQEWLDAIIVEVTAPTGIDMSDSEKRSLVSDVVGVAYDNHPYFKQAVTEQHLGAGSFVLFAQYGEVIRRMAGAGAVPLDETLEVLYANRDFLECFKTDSPEQLAARLVYVRTHKPAVWRASRETWLALRLNEDAPRVADTLLDKYAADDIAVLLYAGYENEVLFAAEAVDKFGDLAIYILNHYVRSNGFHDALRQNFGPRLVPYIAKFGDQGLDRLKDNQAWLDKYFERDGTPKEEEWWTQLPVGAALNVTRNWVKGYPNEWSELGWAALDVADAALAVASLGASEVASQSIKKGTEAAVKNVAKAARTQAQEALLRAGQKRATRDLTGDGARMAAKRESKSLLRRAIAQGAGFAEVVKGPAGKVWKFAMGTTHKVLVPAEKVAEAAKKFQNSWQSIPAAYRKTVYRSLLAVGLFLTISERTIPALDKVGDAAGAFVGNLIKNAGNALAEGLKSGIEEALSLDRGQGNRWLSWFVYLVVVVLLGASSWKLCPIGKGGLRYV